jgi:hypothetical protein
MIVLIPMATGQQISKEVRSSIKTQTIHTWVHPVRRAGIIKSNRNYSKQRIKGEEDSREACKALVRRCYFLGEYAIMQDYDREHLYNTNYQDMKNFLDTHREYGAVSISGLKGKKEEDHVDIGCVMYRNIVFMDLVFKNKYGRCLCNEITEQIRGMNKKFGYLDGITRTKEILNRRFSPSKTLY